MYLLSFMLLAEPICIGVLDLDIPFNLVQDSFETEVSGSGFGVPQFPE